MINIIIGFSFAVSLFVVANYIQKLRSKNASKIMGDILKEMKKDEDRISYTYSPGPIYSSTFMEMKIPKVSVLSKDELYDAALDDFERSKITSEEFRDICKMLDQGKLMDAQNKIFKL